MTNIESRTISRAAAAAVVDAAIAEATSLGVAVIVSVVDPSGLPVAMERMDGAPMLSIDVAADKAWTVASFGHSTSWWAELLDQDPSLVALGANNRLMPIPGGVPLRDGDAMIGGIGVSGATAQQDEQIALAGAGALGSVLTLARMERRVRDYFDACNTGDADAVAAHFLPDGVHYFPPGMYEGPFVGAETIGRKWSDAVANLGSVWTVDSFVGDATSGVAVIEWSHFKSFSGTVLRGDEWYRFDQETGLIAEIRAYYASPQDPSLDRLELGGFDYEARGFPLVPPIRRTPS